MTKLRCVLLITVTVGCVLAGVASAQPAPATDAIATVNGKPLARALFYDRLQQVSGEKVLADLIARQLLVDAFEKAGLLVTEADVTAEIAQFRAQVPDEASWQQFLQQQGLDETSLREAVSFQMRVQKLSEKDVAVTDEALKQHFDENAAAFGRPETVVVSEIVVKDKKQAEQIRQQLQQRGADFAALAREKSLSPTKADDGKRPEEQVCEMQPEALRSVVAGLKARQISQPVAVQNLWWIVRLDRRRAAQPAEFAAVKEQVRQQYVQAHAKQVPQLIEELRQAAQVQILDARYEKLQGMFGPQAATPAPAGQQ